MDNEIKECTITQNRLISQPREFLGPYVHVAPTHRPNNTMAQIYAAAGRRKWDFLLILTVVFDIQRTVHHDMFL